MQSRSIGVQLELDDCFVDQCACVLVYVFIFTLYNNNYDKYT